MEQGKNPESFRDSSADEPVRALAASSPAASPPSLPAVQPAFDPVPVRFRCDGWTPQRQRAFVDFLSIKGGNPIAPNIIFGVTFV